MPRTAPWSKSFSAELYNQAMRISGYEPTIGPALAALSVAEDSILEIGPGDGGLSRYLWPDKASYQAIEIDPHMVRSLRQRLTKHPEINSRIIEGDWQSIDWQSIPAVDTGFAANTHGLTDGAATLWQQFRKICRKRIIWIVPAQKAPRSWCLAGIFPQKIHGLPEKPGVETTFEKLEGIAPKPLVQTFDWQFQQQFPSREAAKTFIQDKLESCEESAWLPFLEENLKPSNGGWIASAPKRSALLIWDLES